MKIIIAFDKVFSFFAGNLKVEKSWDWRNGSEVESFCSCWGPVFSSYHPCGGSPSSGTIHFQGTWLLLLTSTGSRHNTNACKMNKAFVKIIFCLLLSVRILPSCMCVHHVHAVAAETRRGRQMPWGWSPRWMWAVWVFGKYSKLLYCWDIASAPNKAFKKV